MIFMKAYIYFALLLNIRLTPIFFESVSAAFLSIITGVLKSRKLYSNPLEIGVSLLFFRQVNFEVYQSNRTRARPFWEFFRSFGTRPTITCSNTVLTGVGNSSRSFVCFVNRFSITSSVIYSLLQIHTYIVKFELKSKFTHSFRH